MNTNLPPDWIRKDHLNEASGQPPIAATAAKLSNVKLTILICAAIVLKIAAAILCCL